MQASQGAALHRAAQAGLSGAVVLEHQAVPCVLHGRAHGRRDVVPGEEHALDPVPADPPPRRRPGQTHQLAGHAHQADGGEPT